MLSWDDFRYVKAIAQARSLAGAGEHLGVNHSTVFRRLGQIEEQLGSRLFERRRAGDALTPCGGEMVDLAERMWAEIIDFERRVTGQDLRPSGELRITTSDVLLGISSLTCSSRFAAPIRRSSWTSRCRTSGST